MFTDGFQNVIANLGTSRDKASGVVFTGYAPRIDEYIRMYEDSEIARKVIEQIPDDATRKWRSWQADHAQLDKLETYEKALGLRDKVKETLQWSRLTGVHYLYMDIQDGQTPDQPVNLNRVGKGGLRFVVPLAWSDVSPSEADSDPMSPGYGWPKYYSIASISSSVSNLTQIHPSRIIRWHGRERPNIGLMGRDGMSVFAGMETPIWQYEGAVANVASLIYEAKIDVLTIPGLSDMFQNTEQEAIFTRYMQSLMAMKGVNGTLILPGSTSKDGVSSSYDQKNVSFATLPDLLVSFERQVAAKAGIPHSLLFGRVGSGGIGNNGDMELASYYDRIGEMQSNDIEPRLTILDECLIRSALGNRPPEIWYEWASLWQQSDKEKIENADKLASTVEKLVRAGVVPAEVLSQPTVTGLVNIGVLPGLDQEYTEFIDGGGELTEPEEPTDIVPVTDWVKPKSVEDSALEMLEKYLET
jgi:phage-related protein (TIGR01555 family)